MTYKFVIFKHEPSDRITIDQLNAFLEDAEFVVIGDVCSERMESIDSIIGVTEGHRGAQVQYGTGFFDWGYNVTGKFISDPVRETTYKRTPDHKRDWMEFSGYDVPLKDPGLARDYKSMVSLYPKVEGHDSSLGFKAEIDDNGFCQCKSCKIKRNGKI